MEEDELTIRVKDGSGFKTSLGDQVNNLIYFEGISARESLLFSGSAHPRKLNQDWRVKEECLA